MKKFMLLFVICAVAIVMHAQVGGEIFAGYDHYWETIDGKSGDAMGDLYFGLGWSYELNDNFTLDPELIFRLSGISGVDEEFEDDFPQNILELNGKFHYNFELDFLSGLAVVPYLGWNFSYNLDADEDETAFSIPFGADIVYTLEMNNLEISPYLGLGLTMLTNTVDDEFVKENALNFDLSLGLEVVLNSKISLGVEYSMGMIELHEKSDDKAYNLNFQLGFRF